MIGCACSKEMLIGVAGVGEGHPGNALEVGHWPYVLAVEQGEGHCFQQKHLSNQQERWSIKIPLNLEGANLRITLIHIFKLTTNKWNSRTHLGDVFRMT